MDTRFDQSLQTLSDELIRMGALCEDAITAALRALLENDAHAVQTAAFLEEEINRKERDIEQLCMQLLLRYHPVASDLRNISCALKMIADMERIGDQALDIATLAGQFPLLSALAHTEIAAMAQHTMKMVRQSIDAFVRRDLQTARSVIAYDDVVDALFLEVKRGIIQMIQSESDSSEAAADLLMIAKYLERIGDHAVNIAERVAFSISGVQEE
ncbi:MAG: phosphate signaling complex protein PhoU [Oscillospiraceae bacterium]|jgi:phosphate transport system protein|nr:phosphate signaling complex protein PhoU [Oscillospiraceae bacterium]